MANEQKYIKTQWHTGDAITQEKMNHIEEGIENLNTTLDAITGIDNNIGNITTQVSSNTTAIETINGRLEGIDTQLQQEGSSGSWAAGQIHAATDAITGSDKTFRDLNTRFGQVEEMAETANNTATTVQGWVNNAKVIGGNIFDPKINNFRPAESLAERIGEINRLIANAESTANTVAQIIDPTNGISFEQRLTALDANTTPSMNVPQIITELTSARGQNSEGGNNTSLAQRFNQDEARISTNETDIGNLKTGKLNADSTGIINSLDETYINRALSANMGNTIKRMLGTGVGTDQGTTVVDMINSAQQSASNSANSYTDGLLGTGFDTTNTVAKAISDLESETTDITDALDNRLDEIENALDTAKTSSVVRTPGANEGDPDTDTTYTSLDARLEAIENHAANVRSDINTIADELNMVNTQTGAIQDTNSRVDTIEANVVAMAKEIGMLQDDDAVVDLSTAVSRTTTRVDNIEDEISAAHRASSGHFEEDIETHEQIEIDDTLDLRFDDIETAIDHVQGANDETPNGLKQRIAALENTVDTAESGLSDRMAAAETRLGNIDNSSTGALKGLDDRLNAIDGGNTLDTTNGTLGARVSAAESAINDLQTAPKSATVIIEEDCITYDSVTGDPTIFLDNTKTAGEEITPIEDVDYLLGKTINNETKYFYWKYMGIAPNGHWELISGDGGSGTGNNNAEDYDTVAAFEIAEKEENKDYYVLESDNIRHHYRYLKSTNENDVVTWRRIEIGIPTNVLKSYQIARTQVIDELTQTSTDYLDFYGFDFGTNVSSDDVDTVQNYESYRIGRIELPKGGGGESLGGHRIYAKVRGDQAQRIAWSTAQNNGVRINYGYTCYSFNDLDGYDYVSLQGTLTDENNNVIETYNVPYLEYADYTSGIANITTKNLLQYCAKNETKSFTLTLHANIPNETIADKTLTVSITLVELALTSTFSDQQTYSINNNLVIPYEFLGMNDQSPTFEILFDNNTIAATVTATNIIIRKESLVGKQGIHNLTIRASQQIGGSALYSDPLTYQLGLVSGINDTLMLFSGMSLQTLYNEQYKLLKLPYYLYVPNNETVEVSFVGERLTYVEDVITGREIVSELYRPTELLSTGSYNYLFRLHDMIADTEYYAITITAGTKSLVFYITMNKTAEQINIKTDNLVFDFKPERYSNNVENEASRLWSETNNNITYQMRIPEGAHFDWRTGGWMTIDDVPCFCVKAGSRVEFVQESNGATSPLTLFWPGMEGFGGSNFKCTFKIDNVKTPNTPFLTSLDKETNTIINYGKTILAEKQDIEDDDTLLYNYLNVKYIHTETFNGNKSIKKVIGTTVLDNTPFSNEITQEMRAAAETQAAEKNTKKIKDYISKMYGIVNQASNQEHRDYLLKILAGKDQSATIDYSTIKSEITTYLLTLANAEAVYAQLSTLGTDTTSTVYAYRQVEPVNFDALLNGFVVEGKAGKDGIIAMLQFTFVSTIKTGGTYIQTVSATPISTNSFAKTGTFEVTVTDGVTSEVKKYEVEMLDETANGTYTEIVSIRDASNIETRAYGLELNALGSNIYLPSGIVSYAHSEGDIIEFEYNINPEISGRVNSSIIIYEDGVPSAAKLYTSRNNIFEQTNPGCLTIGSDDCDVYIYKMRLYDKALNNKDILANFYADGLTTDEMMNRYNRNKNLVNATTITPQLIAEECPDLRVIMIEAPNLTGGKTSFIKNTKIRCIYKNGRPEDNWVALNAYHAGQGTSSDNYGAAGRNLDIMFGFDGEDTVIIPKPQKNNYTFDPNYKSIIIKGLDDDNTNDILTAEEYEAAGYNVYYNDTNKEPGTVSLTDESVPNNWFNIKVNIASSENTNNAFLQKRFDRYLPYTTPAKARESKIKNDMEFFNCVIFIKETGTPSEFTEDKDISAADRPWHFYGIGNIGDSKKTDKTRVNVEGDPYEFCIEISDNGLKNSGFNTGVFYISEASKNRSKPNEGYRLDTLQSNIANLNNELTTLQQSEQTDETLRQIATVQAEITRLTACIPEARGLTATTLYVCTNSEYTANGSTYNININSPSSTTLYLIKENTYYRRFMYVNGWFEVGEPITFERTSAGCKYPISHAEWETVSNTYYSALYDLTSGKGWDKSFEFRYDITTKDGETVARNDLEAAMNKLHQQANKKAFADMYTWIVTATDEEFQDEFNIRAVNPTSTWFIKESPLYWYLFTERYTMIDSRAKNTFYHFGKVYITQDEYDGVTKTNYENANAAEYALEHDIQDIKDKNNNIIVSKEDIAAEEIAFRLAAATFIYQHRDTFTINDTLADANHNNGYRFELWDYDNDTALGINNNGQMVFSAGLEDIDKDISGWIYNEAESVIWRRIRENSYDDLGALYVQCKGQCFNAENLIQEFDTLQAQFPEELWRLDFERKYYRPFISKGETTYLNDMANGRKKYQRRQFERNMAIYINSKYQRNGAYDENDIISFRPQFTWTAGRNTQITIKPYSTMYINFMLGNDDQTGKSISQRVQRGESYVIDAADYIHDFNNIQCIIYNASRIMELDGLGNFECKQFILGAAKKLSKLVLGSVEYTNRSMADINNMGLSDGLPLLEELDLTNIEIGKIEDGRWISTAPSTFALDNFPLLKKLNATGCNIRSFTFKDGGMLENIIFPSNLTKIDFKNLYKLVDTYDDQNVLIPAVTLTGAANLTSYNSINSYSNSYQIVQNMLNNAGLNRITQLKLDDIEWTINNLSDLEPLAELQNTLGNNMYLEGTITVLGNWSQILKNQYETLWNNKITFDISQGHETYQTKVTYIESGYQSMNGFIEERIIDRIIVDAGDQIPDLYLANTPLSELPHRNPTIDKIFQFGTLTNDRYTVYSGWTTSKILNDETKTLYQEGYRNTDERCLRAISSDNDELYLYTYYNSTPHPYTVRWCMKPKAATDEQKEIVKEETSQEYGKGYDIAAPTVQEIRKLGYSTFEVIPNGNNYTYRIFKGWEKLPTNIDPKQEEANSSIYTIGPTWLENTVNLDANDPNGFFNDTTNLTLAQLLVLSNMTSSDRNTYPNSKNIVAQKKFKYRMGYEGNDDGYLLVDNIRDGEVKIFNEDTSPEYVKYPGTNEIITPFSNNNGFTLAIDYQFDPNQTASGTAAALVGCYAKDTADTNITGFALYNNYNEYGGALGPEVGFSNMFTSNSGNYRSVGESGKRNIIVLRHPKNSNDLYIYSSRVPTEESTYYNTQVIESSIKLGSLTLNSNAKLTWGHLIAELSNPNFITETTNKQYQREKDNIRRAYGTIYWAKYWTEDLGYGECMQLAAWPHEEMTAIISDISTSKTVGTRPSIYLTTLNGSNHMGINSPKFATGGINTPKIIGWKDSLIETLYENRIFSGLPIELQSIINSTSLGYKNYRSESMIVDEYGTVSQITQLDTLLSTTNYIYCPSVSSLSNENRFNTYKEESIYERNGHSESGANTNLTPFVWIASAENLMEVYQRNGNSWTATDVNQSYLNLRFPYIPITFSVNNKLRIFILTSSDVQNTNFKNLINNIHTGDIVFYSNKAYMYVSGNDINYYGIYTLPVTTETYYLNTNNNGGWIQSLTYPTRSVSSVQASSNYIFISYKGQIISPEDSNTQPNILNLNYSFTI